ncbi:DUF6197 family protein [Streptomyces griseorubiginosus]|uniref:DUF6197 family protein n=1 Tax=Streptomyces griseorubiginosus TaxID=67304 RepID=UPI0033341BC5
MNPPTTAQRPQAAPRPAAPARPVHRPTPHTQAPAPVQAPPNLLDPPSWGQRLLPRAVREGMEALGWWTNPIPQKPSVHLAQVLAALEKYGWCKSLDVAPSGRMCIRGAQTMLQRAGHVTEHDRAKAVHYLQQSLHEIGVDQPFFYWNDLDERTFPQVRQRIQRAIHLAHTHGE